MTKGIRRSIYYNAIIFTIIFAAKIRVSAQVLTPELPLQKWLVLTEEQYAQQHYALAAQSATAFLSKYQNTGDIIAKDDIDKARFYLTMAHLKLSHPGCADSAIAFINTHTNPAYIQRAAYLLGQYYFNNNRFKEAIPYYEQAGIANLANHEIPNAKFELAYSYFNQKQFTKAEPLLASIKEISGKYYDAGNYYYGLLAYNRGKYSDALQSFERIADKKEYRDIVPYYIAEIHYFTGNKQKAVDDAIKLINSKEKSYYDNDLHLLTAQVLFEQKKYSEALPYFEHYYNNVEKIRKEDLYEMAYCYYVVEQWKSAIDKFKPLSNARDSLGQTAMYLLGDCYLKTSDKKSARNAFSLCSDMSFNPEQQEASLILTAKLSYEMGYNDEAINYIKELLYAFPSSRYTDEAKTLLSDLLIKTNNYREAFRSIQEVSTRDASYWRVRQKVTYGYAMQQLQNGNLTGADSLLDLSLERPVDITYEAVASFWKGDVSNKLRRYNDAIIYTKRFLQAAGNNNTQKLSPAATIENAHLNLGYASMENKDFSAAQEYFSHARTPQDEHSETAINTILRQADATFMQKNFAAAERLYDKVIAANGSDADYARFQKAILLGLQRKNAEKAALLQTIINQIPTSAYNIDARYEIALTYIEEDKYELAITSLKPLTQIAERQDLAPKALMKIGFSNQQINNTEGAIEAYRKIVTSYPASEERPAALDALKGLYIQNNNPAEYAKLLGENNLSTDGNDVDSAYYVAAETQFSSGNWANSKKSFTEYLTKYPNGVFAVKAHFYKGESHFQLKEYKAALQEYDIVLNNPWTDFSENSARHASTLAFQDKNYEAALKYFSRYRDYAMGQEALQQAYSGLMQSSFELNRHEESSLYADTLLSIAGSNTTLTNDALLYKARSVYKLGKPEEAVLIYKQLEGSKKPAIASEAQYHIAQSYVKQEQWKEAEAMANKAIQTGGNDYWVVKSYILLADILVQQKDYFNAKATLQSIVKNTKVPELKQEATAKLEEVKALEKEKSKLSDQ